MTPKNRKQLIFGMAKFYNFLVHMLLNVWTRYLSGGFAAVFAWRSTGCVYVP